MNEMIEEFFITQTALDHPARKYIHEHIDYISTYFKTTVINGVNPYESIYQERVNTIIQMLKTTTSKEQCNEAFIQARYYFNEQLDIQKKILGKDGLAWTAYYAAFQTVNAFDDLVNNGIKMRHHKKELPKTAKEWLEQKADKIFNLLYMPLDIIDNGAEALAQRLFPMPTQEKVNKKVEYMKQTYGFKDVIMEEASTPYTQMDFLKKMDSVLKKFCAHTGISPKAVSFNGKTRLSFLPRLMGVSNAGAMAYGSSTLMFSYTSEKQMMNHWIHEYTHALDATAGSIFKQKNDKEDILPDFIHLSSIVAMESATGMSHLLSIKEKKINSQPEDELIKNQIAKILGIEDMKVHQNQSLNKVFQVRDDMGKALLLEILKNSSIDYSSLTTLEQNLILRDQVFLGLSSVILIQALEKHHINLEHSAEYLKGVMNYFFSKTSQFRPTYHAMSEDEINNVVTRLMTTEYCEDLTKNIRQIATQSGLIIFPEEHQKFLYFSNSEYVKKSSEAFIYGDNKLYYTTPTELLARYTEKILHPVLKEENQAYPSYKEATKGLELLKGLIDYVGLPRHENTLNLPKPGTLASKVKALRNQILDTMSANRNKIQL